MTDTVRARSYVRRVIDVELDDLIAGGATAIALEGAKAVGKTATGAERATRILLLEEPEIRQVVEADPSRVVSDETVLIDEWQHVPSTWDAVRRAVDRGARPGQFFLTGSASAKHSGMHSGAGRILKVRMRPMTLAERGVEEPAVSLSDLLTGSKPEISGSTAVGLVDYVDEITKSGFPAIRGLGARVRRAQLNSYIDRVIDHDFTDLTGRRLRNPAALRRWLAAYAAATGTVASFEKIRAAATSGEHEKPAKTTTGPYRDALESLYVLDPIPAWTTSNNHVHELASSPKHHLADPALAATILGIGSDALLEGDDGGIRIPRNGTLLGALFESLVALNARVFAQGATANVGHLRTHRGDHEVDLIVERQDRKVVALEVKLSGVVDDSDVRHLLWLRETIGDDLLDAAVVTTGQYAYRRTDGIAVIPAALLGP